MKGVAYVALVHWLSQRQLDGSHRTSFKDGKINSRSLDKQKGGSKTLHKMLPVYMF